MEVNVLEEKKTRLVFEIIGESNTLTGALKSELRTDDNVKTAAYHVEHPLIEKPRFVVEGDDARKAVNAAFKRLSKNIDKLKDGAKTLK